VSRPVSLVVALTMVLGVGACSSGDQKGELEWVAHLSPGDCVDPGKQASTSVVRMLVVPCRDSHAMEVYARLPYPPVTATSAPAASATPTPSASVLGASPWKAVLATPTPPAATATASSIEYPGRDVLRTYAREACAAHFRAYLGSNTREPWYFLTYLFPSVASWTAASEKRPKLGPLARLVTSSTRSDRSVVCFVRTTGPVLTASVRGRRTTPTATPTTTPTTTATPEGIETS
jgi:hypothetical protein